jgi:alanyl-tRNA synthetase
MRLLRGLPACLLAQIDAAGDNKLGGKVATTIVKTCNQVAFMAVSVIEDKIHLSCIVPESVAATGFTANAWMTEALEAVGGRGGGKGATAQGQVADTSKLGETIAAANAAAAKALP